MTEIRCTVPLRVRISGDPLQVPAAELEARLTRTIAGRIAAARQAVGRRHRGRRSESASAPAFRFPEGFSQEARDRVRGAIERAVARALAGDQGAAGPGITLASFPAGGGPAARARPRVQRPWLVLRSIDFHARLGDFLDVIIDIRPELAGARTLYLEHLDEIRWVETWLVRVNRRYLLSEILPILIQRATELGHVRGNQTLAHISAPTERLRRNLTAIDRDRTVTAQIPDLTANAARYRREGDDLVLDAGALLLFAWMIVPKVELADFAELGAPSRFDLPLDDLAPTVDPGAFETFFDIPLRTFIDEVPDARGTLVLSPFTVRRRVLTPTLNLLLGNSIAASEGSSAFRSGNVELLNDTTLSVLPAAAQSAARAATDAATRALSDEAIEESWQPGWHGAGIYALFEPTLEQRQAAVHRPGARDAADAAVAWLRRDWSDFITRLGFLSWLQARFRVSDRLPFEYFLAELDMRESGRWFAALFDRVRESEHGDLIQALLVRALATRYNSDSRVQSLYQFFNAAHVAALNHAYSVEQQAIQLDRSGPWIGVNEVIGQVNSLYTLDKTRKVLHAEKSDALAAAARDASQALIGRIFRGEDTREYDEQSFLAAVLGEAAQRVGLTEDDFDDQEVRRSIRLLGIERRVIDAIDHYWIRYDLVESVDGGEWLPVEHSETAKTDSEFELEIWWWVYHKTAKVVEIFAIGVSVVAVGVFAIEAGIVGLLIEAAGGAGTVVFSITLSELLYLGGLIYHDRHFTWEGFFIAALDGYLTALTFRGAGIIGRGLARGIGGATLQRLLRGWFVERLTVGLIGGASTGAVLTFTHGIFDVILHGGSAPGLQTYVRNIGYGALFGMAVELGIGAAAPILRAGGETALQTAEQAVARIRAAGISAEQLAVMSGQITAAIRNQLREALEEAAVRGISGAVEQKMTELLRWYAGEARLALFRRVVELAPEALSVRAGERTLLSQRAATGVERLVAASGRAFSDQALLDIFNSVPAAQLRQFFEAAGALRADALEQIARSGQLPRLAANPQVLGFLSRDVTVSALIAEESAHGAGIATFRVRRLIDLAELRSNLPSEFRRGRVAFSRADGKPIIFEVEEHPELFVKPGGGRLPREAAALVELELFGIPTVYGTTVVVEGQTQMLIQRIEGVGSKEIVGRAKQLLRPPQNTEVVTQRTIDDLHRIRDILVHNRVRPGDFQFIVRRSDGAVFINDPTGISFNVPTQEGGQLGRIIEQFESIWRRRQRGELP